MDLRTAEGTLISAQRSGASVVITFDKSLRELNLAQEEARQIGSFLVNQAQATEHRVPRLGCAAVVKTEDNRILMGIRGKEPNKGKWILPGGGIEFLESFGQTLEREILEETGLKVKAGKIIGVYELLNPPNEHRVIIYAWAAYDGGKLKLDPSDLSKASFLSHEQVKSLFLKGEITETVSKVLKDIGWA